MKMVSANTVERMVKQMNKMCPKCLHDCEPSALRHGDDPAIDERIYSYKCMHCYCFFEYTITTTRTLTVKKNE